MRAGAWLLRSQSSCSHWQHRPKALISGDSSFCKAKGAIAHASVSTSTSPMSQEAHHDTARLGRVCDARAFACLQANMLPPYRCARFERQPFRRSRTSMVSALDLERLCSFCRHLAPKGIRKSPSLLKRCPAATPPTRGGREHVSCFSLFTMSMRFGKAKTRNTFMTSTNVNGVSSFPEGKGAKASCQAAKRRHLQGLISLKGSTALACSVEHAVAQPIRQALRTSAFCLWQKAGGSRRT